MGCYFLEVYKTFLFVVTVKRVINENNLKINVSFVCWSQLFIN